MCLEGLNKSTNSQKRTVGFLPNTSEALELQQISSPPSVTSFHSTDREMIPARKATGAKVQVFVGSNTPLLIILKAYLPCLPNNALLEMLDVFTLCGVE